MCFEIRRPPRQATNSPSPATQDFVEFLEANPNTWARLHTYSSLDSAAKRRKRSMRKYKSQGFQFIARSEPDGYSVYGRKVVPTLARDIEG